MSKDIETVMNRLITSCVMMIVFREFSTGAPTLTRAYEAASCIMSPGSANFMVSDLFVRTFI